MCASWFLMSDLILSSRAGRSPQARNDTVKEGGGGGGRPGGGRGRLMNALRLTPSMKRVFSPDKMSDSWTVLQNAPVV